MVNRKTRWTFTPVLARINTGWRHQNQDIAQLGRALRLERRGRRFKPCYPDQLKLKDISIVVAIRYKITYEETF
jgi:hypothetical protein